MTMPHLMNCPHSDDSHCLDCVKKAYDDADARDKEHRAEIERLRAERDELLAWKANQQQALIKASVLLIELRADGDGILDGIESLRSRITALESELLRVRTTGHGAAHELDNIAVECGLGHSPKPGTVAAHVRELESLCRVLAARVRSCEHMLACYRVGRRPSEMALDTARSTSDAVDAHPLAAKHITEPHP